MNEIKNICDIFLCNLAEKRNMQEFKGKTNIDFDDLKEDCFIIIKCFIFMFITVMKKK